jgi:hypothetical protein
MTSFAEAINEQEARTQNYMKARKTTAKACVDLFFKIGASRGKDIRPNFEAAYVENSDYALRTLQWARDVRGGAGERKLFRDLLLHLANAYPVTALRILDKVPEIGRWDDLLLPFENKEVKAYAFELYHKAILDGNGLAAKWAPRKGVVAKELREAWGMSPKQYRKTIVNLTNVVETKMCKKDWKTIEFSKVPSVAHARYKAAFYKNAEDVYEAYVKRLMNPKDKTEKVNAGAVYPYDVLKGLVSYYGHRNMSQTEKNLILAQWDALPNFMGKAKMLPLVDVSGSMTCPVGGNKGNLTCLDVAVSLGLYCADKNEGPFKDCFLTFTGSPQLVNLKGNILQKVDQMVNADWAMNTNLHAAFDKILDVAVTNKVAPEDMPEMLTIFSDMQFDRCVEFDDSAFEMIVRKYVAAGYEVPKIVFWNLNAYDNVPVKFNETGVALVSGFSPTVMKSLLAGDLEQFTPEAIMLKTIMDERYNY